MPSMTIQFHALPEELADFIIAGTAGAKVYFALVGGLPFSASVVQASVLRAVLLEASQAKTPLSLCVLSAPPALSAKSRLQFYDLNPAHVLIDIGLQTASGLKQSRISSVASDPTVIGLAKAIAKELRKHSHSGVTAVNVELGVSHVNKNLRYTDAAKRLEESGLPMLPFGGGAKLILGVSS